MAIFNSYVSLPEGKCCRPSEAQLQSTEEQAKSAKDAGAEGHSMPQAVGV